jgi:hypothetical protein
MLANVAAAHRAGRNPDVFYPGWREKVMGS